MSTDPRRYFRIVTLATLVACRDRNAETSQHQDASAPIVVPSAAPSSSTAGKAGDAKQDEVVIVTMAWNAALSRRDAPALRRVYGEKVRLYEETIDREKAIARKAAAFKAAPDYTQSIASLKVDRSQPERPTIEFLKTWKTSGKESSIRGVLVFGKEAGDNGESPHLVIVEESDVATDKKRLAALKAEASLSSRVRRPSKWIRARAPSPCRRSRCRLTRRSSRA